MGDAGAAPPWARLLALVLVVAAAAPATCQAGANASDAAGRPGDVPWTIVRTASLASDAGSVWSSIGDPEVFLQVAFKHITYSVVSSYEGSSTYIVELPSGEEFFLDLKSTSESERYHHFRVGGHTAGIFNGPSIEGSELFISIAEEADNTFVSPVFSVAEVGWLADVTPEDSEPKVNAVMDGLLRVQLDNLRVEFGASDCFHEGEGFPRSVSGVCNNPENVGWGTAFSPLRRLPVNDPLYADGQSKPSGSDISARFISNALCAAGEENSTRDDARNDHLVTDIFVFFGQFIDHDLDLSPTGLLGDSHQPLFTGGTAKFHDKLPIPVPVDDEFMPGLGEMAFERAAWVREDNEAVTPRQHLNRLSSYLDLSQVYGSTHIRAGVLRTGRAGQLRTSGGDLLPYNGDGGDGSVGLSLANDPDASPDFYIAGDVRANENILLTSQHVLWLREHNRVAASLAAAFPDYDDETLFNTARAIVIAEYQGVIYNEWLPRLLGPGALPAADYEYDFTLDASISTFFSTAAFRFGHSMVNKFLWVADDAAPGPGGFAPSPTKTVALRDAFFNPDSFKDAGVDGLLLGAAWHQAPQLDVKIVDDLRNFLFANLNDDPGSPNKDLAAFNIQRGRDMGLPTYNKAREAFGLPAVRDFEDIAADGRVAGLLKEVYVEVENVDAFIGGLAEDPVPGAILGPLFHVAIEEQFSRLRDGDRLFYKNIPFSDDLVRKYPPLAAVLADRVTLADIISNNTGIPREALTRGGRDSVFDLQDPRGLAQSAGRRMLGTSF